MILSETDVKKYIDGRQLLEGLKAGFKSVARGEMQIPHRPEIKVPGKGFMLSMPAWIQGGPMMVKMVNVFEANLDIDLPSHLATIVLIDENTGKTLCIMDGTYVTAIRTSAGAVASVEALAKANARTATLIGAGVQGREHLGLLPLVRKFEKIYVASKEFADAKLLAATCPVAEAVEDVESAVRQSDVVCLASHSYEPVIDPDWVRPGTHVSSVGYAPPRGELPPTLAARGRLFVEDLCAFEPVPVGCAELAGLDPAIATVFGEALINSERPRRDDQEITIYKAMGIAMEDLVAAHIAYNAALFAGHQTYAMF